MGLKISTFKKGGQTFIDAYGKIGRIKYDNNSKIAQFSIQIFPTKADSNLITEFKTQWIIFEVGTDMIAQCYTRINNIISQTKVNILEQQNIIDTIVNNDNLKVQKINQLMYLKQTEILQLDGATEW